MAKAKIVEREMENGPVTSYISVGAPQ